MTNSRNIACLTFAAFVFMGGAAPLMAQQGNPSAPGSNCQAPPQGRTSPTQNGQTAAGGPSLNDCNGVLAPPATGDHGLVTPAPQSGNMPVIKPGDQPKSQPGETAPQQ
ncbi:hypothetical protein [Oryzifoliimicrobium ureilyticus]|uniref:hypothetical protein n=1 Tax=Oryzifoliimicrobium ureilyticus TaxID=3113724 RepID=UPI0030764E33